MKAYTGLDQPLPVQYFRYLKNLVVHQDLGDLIKKDGVKVSEIIAESFPVSLALGVFSIGIALIVGIPAGVIAAVRKNTVIDYSALAFAMVAATGDIRFGLWYPIAVAGLCVVIGLLWLPETFRRSLD